MHENEYIGCCKLVLTENFDISLYEKQINTKQKKYPIDIEVWIVAFPQKTYWKTFPDQCHLESGIWLMVSVIECMSFKVILSMASSLFVAPSISWSTSTTYFWLDFFVLKIQKGLYHISKLPKQWVKSSFLVTLFFFFFFLVFCHSQEQCNTNAAANPTSIHSKISAALSFILLFDTKVIFFRNKTLIKLLCGRWHTSQGMHRGRLEDNVWTSVLPSSLVASAFTYCTLLQLSNHCNSASSEVPLLKLKESGFG